MAKYLFRIDDICPEMNWEHFERLIKIFERYSVKPLLGVIPDNQNKVLKIDKPNPQFWQRIKELNNEGFTVGMHGYQHKYINKNGGLLNISQGSEFAGLPYEIQLEQIKRGKGILEENGIKVEIFIAPGHSFDENTIKTLRETGFKYISDGISLWPFEKYEMIWIPQIAWKLKKIPFGIITFCLHPNNFIEEDFKRIENFIEENQKNIVNFSWILNWYKQQKILKLLLFQLINKIFHPIWYMRLHLLKIIKKDKTS